MCLAYGGKVGYAKQLMHGKQSRTVLDTNSVLFRGLPEQVEVARYHSLAAVEETLPSVLRVTARTADGEIMAIEHKNYPVYGVQFHPESILTPTGTAMVKNFLRAAKILA